MKKAAVLLFAVLLIGSAFAALSVEADAPSTANWESHAFDGANTNFDPQTVINISNAANLQIQWIYQVPVNPFSIPGAPPALGIETTPLVVSGVVYLATPYNRLIALNAKSGHELWHFQVNMSEFISDPWWSQAYTISSIAYSNGTIYMMASDTSVYAINAFSGAVVFKIPATGADIPGNTGTYFGEKAPVIYRNSIIVRGSTTEYGGRGYVSAYDLTTRNLVWRWYSVPPSGGDPNWDVNASLGNVRAYPGDWGNNSLIGGGAAWGLMTVDEQAGLLYFSTGHPSGTYDAALRPGPNLYTDSIIALNATNGRMVWYYQLNSHDVTEGEGGWSITLGTITVNGQSRKVLIQGAKNDYIYVLDAATGKPVYAPIKVGAQQSNSPNINKVADADLTLSQETMLSGGRICPGPDGGIEMSPALDGSTLFVASQNACGLIFKGPITYKGQTIQGYVIEGDPSATQDSTLYSIDLSTGSINWQFQMPDRYQGSSAVVSGGVVYIVDRQGTLYMLDERNGALLRSVDLNGIGASGVSIGQDSSGRMMLFVPAGGGDIPTPTAGVVVGFAVVGGGNGSSGGKALDLTTTEIGAVAIAVVVVAVGAYILVERGKKRPPVKTVEA